jgi:hypothetical protein
MGANRLATGSAASRNSAAGHAWEVSMSDNILQVMPQSRRQAVAVNAIVALAVPPKVAGQMLGVGLTFIYALLKRGELQSFLDGGVRRVLVSSITDYIARKVAAGEPAKRSRPGSTGRPRKKPAENIQPTP